jgi:hypothetical protein
MTEQERTDKLKARMSRWQAYVDKPQADTVQQTAEIPGTDVDLHVGRTVHAPDRPQPRLLSAPSAESSTEHSVVQTPAAPETVIGLQEARIADLEAAIAREREQADRLADEVKRAQTLHAATIYAHMTDEKVRKAEPRPFQPPIPDITPNYYDAAQRKGQVIVFGLLLAIAAVLVLTFLLTR